LLHAAFARHLPIHPAHPGGIRQDAGEWRHGYDLCREAGVKSGTLYPMLIRLADQGLLDAEWREAEKPGRPPRHAYRLTPKGLALARSQASASEGAAAGRPALA
jgi:DNA-binding PadR family transcriptional regulator